MANKVNNALRTALVTEWRQVKDSMSQADFIARTSDKHGIKLTARTLRSWCRDLDRARPDHEIDHVRRLVTDALERVQAVEAELQNLLGSLAEVQAAAIATASSALRQPLCDTAADDAVDSTDTNGGAPHVDSNPLTPATPPSTDAPDSTSGSQEPPKSFVWDLD